jgi:dihydroorotase
LTLARLVDLTSAGPVRLFGIAGKGRVGVGYDADLTLVDLKKETVMTDEMMASRVRWTPYAGMRVKGWPIGTMVRGRLVMWQDEILGRAQGAPVRFLQALERSK